MTTRGKKSGPPVTLSVRSDVATVTLSSSGARLDPDAHAALCEVCREIDLEESVRVLVLRGRGARFCEGDTAAVTPEGPDGIAAVGRLRLPTIAQIGGPALDAGLELALACDLRIASSTARFGWTAAAGGIPFHGGTQRLPRAIGATRAARLLLLGESVGAREALRIGLVQRMVAARALASEVRAVARQIAARAPIASRLAKEALRAASDLPLAEGLRLEGDLYVLLQTTRDRTEGVASFHEKRRPRFQGR